MIILTGASGGIGQAIISGLSDIDDVIGIYNRNKPDLPGNPSIKYFKVNLLDQYSIDKFLTECGRDLTNLTVIHAAAIKIDKLAIQLDEDSWDKTIDVNLKSNFLLTKSLLPLMIEQNWGRLVNISSTGAMRGAKGTLAYSASKSGLSGLTRVYATEYARFNITSNLLSLGYFNCGLYDNLSEDVKNRLIDEIPSKELGEVNNIVYAIEFIIKSDFTNGATINIDGGI